jgi:hypothetical protein
MREVAEDVEPTFAFISSSRFFSSAFSFLSFVISRFLDPIVRFHSANNYPRVPLHLGQLFVFQLLLEGLYSRHLGVFSSSLIPRF